MKCPGKSTRLKISQNDPENTEYNDGGMSSSVVAPDPPDSGMSSPVVALDPPDHGMSSPVVVVALDPGFPEPPKPPRIE
jgi:hypothetical protein